MKLQVALLAILTVYTVRAAEPLVNPIDPYAQLRAAYAARDSALAAAAYTPDALLIYRYGEPADVHRGGDEIRRSFAAFFSQIDANLPLDLNFRIQSRQVSNESVVESGVYRLRVGKSQASFGRFNVTRDLSASGAGRFQSDISTSATRSDFERAHGPVLLAATSERLDSSFYGRLTGRYQLDNGCTLIVTQSFVRLFARNNCTQQWRGLTRVAGGVWTAGDQVLSDTVSATFRFEIAEDDATFANAVRIEVDGESQRAVRLDSYTRIPVSFQGSGGVVLAGDLYRPAARAGGVATVLIHGSGEQDRNGYASIMAVMADDLAAAGHVVLTYDKRGAGLSSGDWRIASFSLLAEDATAALAYLRSQPETDAARVGLAGSSQAGWVIARAIERGARPAHVYLLGAAGAALSVAEQNLYNTRVRMQCAGIGAADIELALAQQRLFLEYVRTRGNATQLDALTQRASARPDLADWLFPNSQQINFDEGNWFTTLETDFDPLPVWRRYTGRGLFVFSEFDDSTPTELIIKRLQKTAASSGGRLQIRRLENAQHIGLRASSLCAADLSDSAAFAPDFPQSLRDFAASAMSQSPSKTPDP
ncbi:MAG: alpha/beta fold hydrolase [Steroidobacteraceae bacterium]